MEMQKIFSEECIVYKDREATSSEVTENPSL